MDKLKDFNKKIIILCTICLAALFIFLRVFPFGLSVPFLYAVIIIFTAVSACTMVVAFTTLKELYPIQIAGTSVAIGNFFPFFGGAVYMAFLGKILDGTEPSMGGGYPVEGYITVLTFLAASAVLQLICALNLKETFPEKEFQTIKSSKKNQQSKCTRPSR